MLFRFVLFKESWYCTSGSPTLCVVSIKSLEPSLRSIRVVEMKAVGRIPGRFLAGASSDGPDTLKYISNTVPMNTGWTQFLHFMSSKVFMLERVRTVPFVSYKPACSFNEKILEIRFYIWTT